MEPAGGPITVDLAPDATHASATDATGDRREGSVDHPAPSSPGRQILAASRSRATVWAVGGVLYVTLHAARESLDAGIKKVHPVGVAGASVNSLHNGNHAISTTLATWERGYTDRLAQFMRFDPITLAAWQTGLELALVPVSFGLLAFTLWHLRSKFAGGRKLVLNGALLAALAYAVLGVYNQVVELMVLAKERPMGNWTRVLGATGTIRTVALAFAVVPLVAAIVNLESEKKSDQRLPWWRGAAPSYRIMIVVAVLHAALLLFSIPGEQSADALRLWADDPLLVVAGIGSTVVLAMTLAGFAARLGSRGKPRRQVFGRDATIGLIAIAGAVAAIGWILHWQDARVGPGLASVGTIGLVIGLLSVPLTAQRAVDQQDVVAPTPATREYVPAILASAPLAALTVALIKAAVPSMIDAASSTELIVWAVVTGLLAMIAFPVALGSTRYAISADGGDRLYYVFAAVINAIWIVAAAWLVADPDDHAPDVGVITIMSTFLIALVAVFGVIGNATESKPLPGALDYIGFRRLPVVTLLVVVGFVAQLIAGSSYHDIATVDVALPRQPQLTVEEAFGRWSAAKVDQSPAGGAADDDTRQAVPLVMIAAAGGGIKAAAFTATALDCIFGPTLDGEAPPDAVDPGCATENTWDEVFIASGASGGSVGIASVIAQATNTRAGRGDYGEPVEGEPRAVEWVVDSLGGDMLSPSLAWQLLVETPNAVLAFHPERDRAEILEAAWRERFGAAATMPFYVDRAAADDDAPAEWNGPIAYFSGTNLNDGCRVNVSGVRSGVSEPNAGAGTPPVADGATRRTPCTSRRESSTGQPVALPDQGDTRDLVDYLCEGRNIDLATAAFLSARYPYVSPTGTVTCDTEDGAGDDTIAIGDGGYRDNSGATSIADAWSVIEPIVDDFNDTHATCIVPILLEIDTGYDGFDPPRPSRNAAQLLAPALGAAKVFGDLSYGDIEQVAAEFTRELSPTLEARLDGVAISRHLRVSLIAHPGVTAPLGWSLSPGAAGDFGDQLQVPENAKAIGRLIDLLSGDSSLTCTPPAPPRPEGL